MNFKILILLFFGLILLFNKSNSAISKDLIRKETIFYLSSDGFLIQLDLSDLENIKEISKKSLGKMPWQGVHCGSYLYSTDFASNQIFAYNLIDKSLKNKYLPTEESNSTTVFYNSELEKENKKSNIQRFFNKIHKQKKQESKKLEAIREPLEISNHNKKLGVSSIVCSRDYLFVSASLKERIDVLSKKNLKRISSIKVPSNYNLAVSPDQELLAISSSYLDRIYLLEITNLKKKLEIEVEGNPTQLAWLNKNLLAVLTRENGKIKILDTKTSSITKDLNFQTKINSIQIIPGQNLLVAVSGEDKKAFIINTVNFEYKSFEIDSALRFANLIGILDSDKILIGSSRDGRLVLTKLTNKDFQTLAKIQTNLIPVGFINKENIDAQKVVLTNRTKRKPLSKQKKKTAFIKKSKSLSPKLKSN